jgi:hypothetical protein
VPGWEVQVAAVAPMDWTAAGTDRGARIWVATCRAHARDRAGPYTSDFTSSDIE